MTEGWKPIQIDRLRVITAAYAIESGIDNSDACIVRVEGSNPVPPKVKVIVRGIPCAYLVIDMDGNNLPIAVRDAADLRSLLSCFNPVEFKLDCTDGERAEIAALISWIH